MKTYQSVPFFYDAEAENSGGGSSVGEMVSYSDMMAATAQQDDVQEEEVPAETAAPVAEQTPIETIPVVPEIKAAVAEPIKDWRETVSNDDLISTVKSKFDRKALLSAAGVDEETIKAIEYKEANGGDWNEYLRVKNTDYSKLAPEQLIEMDLRERYKSLDNKRFDIVLRNELKKYNLDRDDYTDDSEEAILGGIMLEQDANAVRGKYIDKQDGLKAPAPLPDTTAQDRELVQQQLSSKIRNSDMVRQLQEKKYISFGEGEDAFNYGVEDIDSLVEAAITAAVQNGSTQTEQDVADMVSTIAFHSNKKGFIKALAAHYKQLGEKGFNNEIRNVKPNESTSTIPTTYRSAAEALAKEGRLVTHAELFG